MPTAGGDEGIHGGAAADKPGPAEPEAAGRTRAGEEESWCNGQWPANTEGAEEEAATTKRVMSGIEVLDSVSKSMSEMSLSSKREAAAAQGLPMWNLCVPPAKEPTITMKVSQ